MIHSKRARSGLCRSGWKEHAEPGAAQFTDAILKEGVPARDRFINMLKAGGSDYAYELYRRAGIDMATAAPYQALVARMNRVMDEIEALEKGN